MIPDTLHIHPADADAGVAAGAFLRIRPDTEKGHRMEQGIDRTQRAQEPAKRAVTDHAKEDAGGEHAGV